MCLLGESRVIVVAGIASLTAAFHGTQVQYTWSESKLQTDLGWQVCSCYTHPAYKIANAGKRSLEPLRAQPLRLPCKDCAPSPALELETGLGLVHER